MPDVARLVPAAGPHALRTVDGVDLAADCWPNETATTAVVVVHGFTADRNEASVVAMTAALRDAGYAVVTYDGRGHGGSGGMCTLGADEQHDVAAAAELARTLAPHVVIVGASMGAIAALRYTASTDDVAGVVVVSCPARWRLRSVRTALSAVLTQTRPGRWLLARRGVRLPAQRWVRSEEPVVLAGRIRCPVAVVHGLADRFMPSREAPILHAAAAGPSRLDLVPGMGHAFHPAGTAAVLDAIAWCVAA